MKPDNWMQQLYRKIGSRMLNPKWYDVLRIAPIAVIAMVYSLLWIAVGYLWKK